MAGHEGGGDKEIYHRRSHQTLRLEPLLDIRSLRGHRFLCPRGHRSQPARVQVHAQEVPHRGIPEETVVNHVGYHHHHPGDLDGTDTIQQSSELRDHGLGTVGGIPLAAGGHPDIAVAACQCQSDQKRLQDLCATAADRLCGHHLPYRPHPQRTGQPHLPASADSLSAVAVVGHPTLQQEHPALRHVLYVHLDGGLHRLSMLFMGGLHAPGRTTAHLVDHAADLHPDHHLHLRLPEDVRGETPVLEEAHHPDLALHVYA